MKIIFKHKNTLKGIDKNGEESHIKEYQYNISFKGLTNSGTYRIIEGGFHSSYKTNAKEAKEDIKQRLTDLGYFDKALDGEKIF